jgi:phospholipid transport system substrate-binding protein
MQRKRATTTCTTPRRSSRRHAGLAAACGLLGLALAGPAGAAESGARAVIETTVDAVLAILQDQSLSKEQRRQGIEEIAYARFDMHTMSRLVLARSWQKFTEPQREEYIREFKRYLANSYGDRIDRYDQQQVAILGERQEPRGDVTVLTKIVGGEFENALVDYRMRQNAGEWKVIDVTVEGISLVSNYRDQFKEVLSRGGPEELLTRLREKNASGVAEGAL